MLWTQAFLHQSWMCELVKATSSSPTVNIYTVEGGQCSSHILRRLISPWKLATDAQQCKFPMDGELNYLTPISVYRESHTLRPCQLYYILSYGMGFLRRTRTAYNLSLDLPSLWEMVPTFAFPAGFWIAHSIWVAFGSKCRLYGQEGWLL